jgi:predicted nucleic acid-binding protein
MPGSFVDTNVLLYFAADVPAARAAEIAASGGAISVQVLNEITNVARRKMHLSWRDTTAFLTSVTGLFTVVPLTLQTHETGLRLAQRYGFAIYDAMIAASGLLAGCDVLWSEDMHHGLLVEDTLRILRRAGSVADASTFSSRSRVAPYGRRRSILGVTSSEGHHEH